MMLFFLTRVLLAAKLDKGAFVRLSLVLTRGLLAAAERYLSARTRRAATRSDDDARRRRRHRQNSGEARNAYVRTPNASGESGEASTAVDLAMEELVTTCRRPEITNGLLKVVSRDGSARSDKKGIGHPRKTR
ncbi:hypothetical protein L596_017747 [Steinernema carpocapsae]|uniref:Uncharacterized protein n=1 Tax=Steinernema carpocapsae TaxID=34508 RepID=A0A4U5N301_STECR|nr:hypothetical protein L596_017747 [Steinernema carpocapsae]